jgi:cob(I)alamin adenosyltransferase
MKIYTRKGDDGSTGLLFGGRVAKTSAFPTAYGTVDELQAHLGVARATATAATVATDADHELVDLVVAIERDLWVLMAELATAPANRPKLTAGSTLVTEEMVTVLERAIDDLSERFDPPTEFVVPGEDLVAAQLDLARAVARRAERAALAAFDAATDGGEPIEGSWALAYLNRLSDLLWTMARAREGHSRLARDTADRHGGAR